MKLLFTMTQEDYDSIVDTITEARNTPLIAIHCGMPRSIQEVANDAWSKLGEKMGFNYMTVEPGDSKLEFYAQPQ